MEYRDMAYTQLMTRWSKTCIQYIHTLESANRGEENCVATYRESFSLLAVALAYNVSRTGLYFFSKGMRLSLWLSVRRPFSGEKGSISMQIAIGTSHPSSLCVCAVLRI